MESSRSDGLSHEESLSAQVYEQIKTKILNLTYEPGSFLTEAKLAAEYSVSRMPIRIAIQKLSNEGWLVSDFRRKLRVKDMNKQDIADIYALREVLETRALEMIFEQDLTRHYSYLVEEKLVRMKAAGDDYHKYIYADTEMHVVFIGIYNNNRINQIYKNVCDEIIRISLFLYRVVSNEPGYLDSIIKGVESIVTSIREKDFDTAMFYLKRDHFSHSVNGEVVADIVDSLWSKEKKGRAKPV